MKKDSIFTKATLDYEVDANMNISAEALNEMREMKTINTTTDGNAFSIGSGIDSQCSNQGGSRDINLIGDYRVGDLTCWRYWQDYYYPTVIKEEYPVYIQERSKDKGKKALEIIKVLRDKKMLNMSKVKDFIDMMDTLINIL